MDVNTNTHFTRSLDTPLQLSAFDSTLICIYANFHNCSFFIATSTGVEESKKHMILMLSSQKVMIFVTIVGFVQGPVSKSSARLRLRSYSYLRQMKLVSLCLRFSKQKSETGLKHSLDLQAGPMCFVVLGFRCQVPCARCPIPGAPYQVPRAPCRSQPSKE